MPNRATFLDDKDGLHVRVGLQVEFGSSTLSATRPNWKAPEAPTGSDRDAAPPRLNDAPAFPDVVLDKQQLEQPTDGPGVVEPAAPDADSIKAPESVPEDAHAEAGSKSPDRQPADDNQAAAAGPVDATTDNHATINDPDRYDLQVIIMAPPFSGDVRQLPPDAVISVCRRSILPLMDFHHNSLYGKPPNSRAFCEAQHRQVERKAAAICAREKAAKEEAARKKAAVEAAEEERMRRRRRDKMHRPPPAFGRGAMIAAAEAAVGPPSLQRINNRPSTPHYVNDSRQHVDYCAHDDPEFEIRRMIERPENAPSNVSDNTSDAVSANEN